jgi:putative hydrolase of the HAD superfamily
MDAPSRLPVLVFDYGNVIAHFDYARAAAPLAARLGTTPAHLLDTLRTHGLNALIIEHETGRISGAEFGRTIREWAGLDLSHDEFVTAWRDIFWLNPPMVDLLARLGAAGYRLVLGSNTNALHADDFLVRFAQAFQPFHRLVLSYQVGAMKPDPAFYLACAQAGGASPLDCLFVDDLPVNIAGARAVGMNAILYDASQHDQFLHDLQHHGIAPHHVPPPLHGNSTP